MQHVNCFSTFLRETVNLSQAKLDLLAVRVEAIYQALKSDPELGPLIIGKKPQGSWAQRTIINPSGRLSVRPSSASRYDCRGNASDDHNRTHLGGARYQASEQPLLEY
ncbi:hypothetical protein ACIOKD_24805 [Streptomyces sp. NPDC087844]|uniref:SMODS domain-containing nucleotidyltransferase n=1 Tax=Streptomyces sp. NPDC087844 TaxID=3365805 RepID=UPI0037F201EE